MTNNITSGKAPKILGNRMKGNLNMPAFQDDAITQEENLAGEMGRLADIQAQTMNNLTDAERAEMFAQSGLKLPKRPAQW